MKYILYKLLPDGTQPYQQVAMLGLTLDGGAVHHDGWYLGDILGEANFHISALADFQAVELTPAQALSFHEKALPIKNEVGKALLDSEGRIYRETVAYRPFPDS